MQSGIKGPSGEVSGKKCCGIWTLVCLSDSFYGKKALENTFEHSPIPPGLLTTLCEILLSVCLHMPEEIPRVKPHPFLLTKILHCPLRTFSATHNEQITWCKYALYFALLQSLQSFLQRCSEWLFSLSTASPVIHLLSPNITTLRQMTAQWNQTNGFYLNSWIPCCAPVQVPMRMGPHMHCSWQAITLPIVSWAWADHGCTFNVN